MPLYEPSAERMPPAAVENDVTNVENRSSTRPRTDMKNERSVWLLCANCGAREIVRMCLTVTSPERGVRGKTPYVLTTRHRVGRSIASGLRVVNNVPRQRLPRGLGGGQRAVPPRVR